MRALLVVTSAVMSVLLLGCVERRAVVRPDTQPAEEPPPGQVLVNFESETDGRVWDVGVGGQFVCQTPCTRPLGAYESVLLRSRKDEVFVPELGPEADRARRALVVAEGRNRAKYVNGLAFTTLGGMGLATGIALTAVGCSNTQERGGMCTAGLIVGGITAALTAFSIWLLVDSAPKAHVIPVFKATLAPGQPPVSIAVTPLGVVGTF
ncbi:MAG: hypothetical protein AB1938_25340 [Myxococcota bacterium]